MRIILSVFILAGIAAPASAEPLAGNEKFAIYYADTAPIEHLKPYQLLVLDSSHHPALPPLKEEGKILLGYLALGEVAQGSPVYGILKSHNLVLQENPNWKGSFYVDVRDPLWAKTVLEDLIPSILRQGFDGLFIDTLDDAVELEENEGSKYAGMTEAAVHLVQAIRQQYPSIKIMLNRAYGILPKVASSVDYELGESVYADYDFKTKTYRKVNDHDYMDQVQTLREAKTLSPELKVYTLDYADPADTKAIAEIYSTERSNGFLPYVATIGLDRLVDEPGTP